METCKHGKANEHGDMCWDCDDERRKEHKTCEHGKLIDPEVITCFDCEANDNPAVIRFDDEPEEDEDNTCHHGVRTNEIECEDCNMENECDDGMEMICEHDMPESDCDECRTN